MDSNISLIAQWGLSDTSRTLLAIFFGIIAVFYLFYQIGIVGFLVNLFTRVTMACIMGGFAVWHRFFSGLSWPLLAIVVSGLMFGGLFPGPLLSIRELIVGLLLLIIGVVACLAYLRVDMERYEVTRGLKTLHNPLKGQSLAESLVLYGDRLGFMLLLIASIATVFGFAFLNHGLFDTVGRDWYRLQSNPSSLEVADIVALYTITPDAPLPGIVHWAGSTSEALSNQRSLRTAELSDFLTYTLINLLRLVDLLDVINTSRFAELSFVSQAKWPASTLLILFKTFFIMVLLQQLFTSIRYARVLTEAVENLWSPHVPIYEQARLTVSAHGMGGVEPVLESISEVESLTPELRNRIADVLANMGPVIVPRLMKAIRDPNPHIRSVAVVALANLKSLPAIKKLTKLTRDPNDLVRQSVAEALMILCQCGPQQLRKEWAMTNHRRAARSSWKYLFWWLRQMVGVSKIDPVNHLVRGLNDLLTDSDKNVRSHAACILGSLGHSATPAIGNLLQLINDPDETVRANVAESLGHIRPQTNEMIVELTKLLNDPSSSVRVAAVTALGNCKELATDSVPQLVSLLTDPDKEIQQAAINAINQIGTLKTAKSELLETLANKDNLVRAQTIEALGEMGNVATDVLPALLRALSDPNDRIRAEATRSLGKIKTNPSKTVPALMQALQDPDHLVCALAAEALGEIGSDAEEAREILMKSLHHVSPNVRANCANALGCLGKVTPNTIRGLVQSTNDEDPRVRIQAIAALGKMGENPPLEVFLSGLKDSDLQVRIQSAISLQLRGEQNETIVQKLVECLEDTNPTFRAAVIRAIGRLAKANADILKILCESLQNDALEIQIAAADALGGYGPNAMEAAPQIIQKITSAILPARLRLLWALTQIRPTEAGEVFATALQDPDPEIRKLATAGLAFSSHIPDEALPYLVESLQDPESRVRANAALALTRCEQVPDSAIPLLVECTAHLDDPTRLNAIRTLRMHQPEALKSEIDRLLNDPSLPIRLEAVGWLVEMSPKDRRATKILEEAMSSAHSGHRQLAEEILATINKEELQEQT